MIANRGPPAKPERSRRAAGPGGSAGLAPAAGGLYKAAMRPWLKLLIEAGPLVVFFVAYSASDLMTATAVFMVAIAAALAVSVAIERRVPIMPLVSAVVVMVFGGLTLWLDDKTFIKM